MATPLLLKELIDNGITPSDRGVVVELALVVAALAVVSGGLTLVERWFSSRIGEGLIYDLRTEVFSHVLRQPIAFFTRAQTGALVTRLNSDVIGAQQAFTSVLSSVVSNVVSLVLIIVAMATLSWQLTLASLAAGAVLPAPRAVHGAAAGRAGPRPDGPQRRPGHADDRAVQRRRRAAGQALRQPRREDREYAAQAGRVRDMGVRIVAQPQQSSSSPSPWWPRWRPRWSTASAALMAVSGSLTVGTLLALTALLGPALRPADLAVQRAGRRHDRAGLLRAGLRGARPPAAGHRAPPTRDRSRPARSRVELDGVRVPLPLGRRGVAGLAGERRRPATARAAASCCATSASTAEPGQLVALVGPSGAGKTTITSLVARLYDPSTGAVRINGVDLREATLESVRRHGRGGHPGGAPLPRHDPGQPRLRRARGHRGRARGGAARPPRSGRSSESLPEGLDTVVGDRGHRLSGGEKQRLAIARLLLKGPGLIVLDEATAHLDSESEAAVQRALDTALRGRTAIVIAHRLSTVRGADQILVVDDGRIVERGTHRELLERGGLYTDLYTTQFADQETRSTDVLRATAVDLASAWTPTAVRAGGGSGVLLVPDPDLLGLGRAVRSGASSPSRYSRRAPNQTSTKPGHHARATTGTRRPGAGRGRCPAARARSGRAGRRAVGEPLDLEDDVGRRAAGCPPAGSTSPRLMLATCPAAGVLPSDGSDRPQPAGDRDRRRSGGGHHVGQGLGVLGVHAPSRGRRARSRPEASTKGTSTS